MKGTKGEGGGRRSKDERRRKRVGNSIPRVSTKQRRNGESQATLRNNVAFSLDGGTSSTLVDSPLHAPFVCRARFTWCLRSRAKCIKMLAFTRLPMNINSFLPLRPRFSLASVIPPELFILSQQENMSRNSVCLPAEGARLHVIKRTRRKIMRVIRVDFELAVSLHDGGNLRNQAYVTVTRGRYSIASFAIFITTQSDRGGGGGLLPGRCCEDEIPRSFGCCLRG